MKYLFTMIAVAVLFVSCGSKGPKVILPKEGQTTISMRVGDTLRLTGNSHPSTGLSSIISFSATGFSMQQEKVYDNKEAMEAHAMGADKATITYTLVALEPGEYEVVNSEKFRGTMKNEAKYTVTIK